MIRHDDTTRKLFWFGTTLALSAWLTLCPAVREARAGLSAPTRAEVINCGNGQVDAGEQCDDANRSDGDGCSKFCLAEESCDNGLDDNDDGLVDCEDLNCDGHPACR